MQRDLRFIGLKGLKKRRLKVEQKTGLTEDQSICLQACKQHQTQKQLETFEP
jgi:hypothetical protein